MKIGLRRTGLLGVAAAIVISAIGFPVTAQRPSAQPANPANVTVDPAFYSTLYYRPLTVFSRGGRVTAVAGVPSDTQTYYLGSAGGVWKTTNAGQRWEPVSDGQFGAGSIGAIMVAESNPNIIYVGTGSACPRGNVSNGDGMYKSTDAGKTWQHIGLEKAGLIGRIAVHPQNPDLAYVAALGNIFGPNPERGVFRTRDGGKTWDHVLKISPDTGAIDVRIDAKNPNILFAGAWAARRQPWSIDSGSTDGGIFRSTDGGTSWTRLTKGLPAGVMVGKTSVSVSRADPKRVYALIEADKDQGGVYRSDDGGETWTRTYAGRNLLQRAWYYIHIYADPVDVDTVYALNTGALKSTDGGKTFQNAGIQAHGDHHDLWINPTNNKAIINSNDGGATVSLDGRTWTEQNNQMTAEIYRLEVDNRWPYYVYGAQQDNSTIAVPSNNQGDTYPVGGGESGYIAVDPRNHNIVYAGSYGGALTRMDRYNGVTDNIRVYADSQTGQRAADLKYRFQWNAPIRISPHNPDVVYTASQYVHKTTDGGQSWTIISPDLSRNDKTKQDYSGGKGITRDNTGVEVYSVVFSFEESPVTRDLLWAGSNDGLLHLSRDGGKNWEKITPTGLPEDSTVNAIELSKKDAGRAIVTAYRYMLNDFTPYAYLTTDYGKTWKRIADGNRGIPNGHFLRVVREDPNRPGLLYGGTEYGMYISFDEGAHWQKFQNNLPIVPIMDLKIHRDELVVATEGRAFWIMEGLPVLQQLKPAAATDNVLFKPSDGYRQGGPFPTFWYWLKEQPTSPVTLEIMDATGAVVSKATGQPGAGVRQPPSAIPAAGGGRGFGADEGGAPPEGAGGRGRGGRGDAPAAQPGAAGQQAGRGGGGRGGGRGGFGGPPVTASAHQGLNRGTWNARIAPNFAIPQGTVMWGGGSGPMKAAPGVYTVKVTSGAWSASQTFRLHSDPRLPALTEAEGAAQVKMAREVGIQIKELYDTLAQLRQVKKDIDDRVAKQRELAPRARQLTEKLVAVESEITQIQGEGGQDALNFPGRIDNQWVALYGNVANLERKLNKAITERYADLKPPTDQLMQRGKGVLSADLAAFNEVLRRAGLPTIDVKPPSPGTNPQ